MSMPVLRPRSFATALLLLGSTFAGDALAGPAAAGISVVGEMIANQAVDPGEGLVISLCVTNPEPAPSGVLTGTLSAQGTIVGVDGETETFGSLAPGQTVCREFAARVPAACGTTAFAVLQLQDLSAVTTSTLSYPLSINSVPLSETFDGVAQPALPAGWAASGTGGPFGWQVSATSLDTAPNRVYAGQPASVSEQILTTPAFTLPAGLTTLSFRHAYTLEQGFDGGVLEIAYNGGPFQDIVAAGGVFLQGGYTGTLSSLFGNPIGGRAAWTGTTSNAYVTTQVRLPAGYAGGAVRLRWRLGTDSSNGGYGWGIDTINVGGGTCLPVATDQPWGLQAAVDGERVALSWAAPLGAAPGGYVLEASLDGGATFPLQLPLGAARTFEAVAPDVATLVRIRGNFIGGALGPASNAVPVVTGALLAPGAPTNLLRGVNGQDVALAWELPETGGTVRQIVLEAGSGPGLADIASLALPPGTRVFRAAGVPPGTYFLRVRQVGPTQSSAASNEVMVTTPGNCGVPAPPVRLRHRTRAGMLRIDWSLGKLGSEAPTAWVLAAAPAIPYFFQVPVDTPYLVAPVPPVPYVVLITAVTPCAFAPGKGGGIIVGPVSPQ